MGAHESKSEEPQNETLDHEIRYCGSKIPSTPILTPLDPRSPSANIARTPLEVVMGNKIQPLNTPKIVLEADPRSPTIEFDRTPIIVPAVAKETLTLHNKNLDNVRKTILPTTPVNSMLKPHSVIPPKLLESSPIVLHPRSTHSQNKRKSFVGLLETNIDFTETDLDSVSAAKEALNRTLPPHVTENCVSPLSNKLKDQMEALNIKSEKATDVSSDLLDEQVEKSSEPQGEIEEEIKSVLAPAEKTINITAHVRDFDKKLSHLIYEDEDESDCKSIVKLAKIKDNNRTPLGVRNSNGDSRKSVNTKLRVSDKPRKSDISKIPVFKEYSNKKIQVQCENTPPRKVDDRKAVKARVSQWDADKTLII